MLGFMTTIPGILLYVVPFLLLCLFSITVFASGHRRASTKETGMKILLFAIVIMLFAIVLKLVSSGMDVFVFIVALVGLGVGWYGVSSEPRAP